MSKVSKILRLLPSARHQSTINVKEKIEQYGNMKPSPLSITKLLQIFECMNIKESYRIARREIAVRLAGAVKEMTLLPLSFRSSDALNTVMQKYIKHFVRFLPFQILEPDSSCTYEDFSQTVHELLQDDCNVVEIMAQGQIDMRKNAVNPHQENMIHWFLDRFFLTRISIRMLCHQHSKLYESEMLPFRGECSCGAIEENMNIVNVIKEAANDAQQIFQKHFEQVPQYTMEIKNLINPAESICLPYINSHLHYIIYEITKNALRAVIEKYTPSKTELPPLKYEIIKGKQNVTVILTDKGGGIPFDILPCIFHYMHTTVKKTEKDQDSCSISSKYPYAGLGYGLPLSRLYARYFNGDILISSIQGYGTKAYLFLNAVTEEMTEVLPVINSSVLKYYSSFPDALSEIC